MKRGFPSRQGAAALGAARPGVRGGYGFQMTRRESLEKTFARVLHRHCNFGWAHYYIPSERFPRLVEELVEAAGSLDEVGHEELVRFFLRAQRLRSAQECAARFEAEYVAQRRPS